MWRVHGLLQSESKLFNRSVGSTQILCWYKAAEWVCSYNSNSRWTNLSALFFMLKASCWHFFRFQCLIFFSLLQNILLQCTELILAFVFLLEWQAHSNAVFDLAWVPGEHKIVSSLLPSSFIFNALATVCRKWLQFLLFLWRSLLQEIRQPRCGM